MLQGAGGGQQDQHIAITLPAVRFSPSSAFFAKQGAVIFWRAVTAPYDAKVAGGTTSSADRFVTAVYQELKLGG